MLLVVTMPKNRQQYQTPKCTSCPMVNQTYILETGKDTPRPKPVHYLCDVMIYCCVVINGVFIYLCYLS